MLLNTAERIRNRIRENHPLDDGHRKVWAIRGEDDNPDLHGHHNTPLLRHVRGTLAQAIEYALTISRFTTYGYGGEIEEYQTPEIIELR